MYIEGLKKDFKEIDSFLQANKHNLVSPEYMFGIDNGQDSAEMFDTAKYRILICFLSPGDVRGVSNTFMALRGIVKKNMGDEVFIDYAYVPDPEDFKTLVTNKIPVWFGNVSHHPVNDYDIMFVSHSIVPESFNFARCLYYSGIPLSREGRFNDSTVPFILYGGAASIVSSNLMGEIPAEYGGGHCLFDAATFGFGEDRLDHVTRFLLEAGIGKKVDKEKILDEGTHKFPYLYDPLGYEFITDETHPLRIKEIRKVKDWLPDKCHICNTYDTNYPGFVHKVFNLDGQNADSSDCQIALGCSGQGACSFKVTGDTYLWTPEGLKRIDQYTGSKVLGKSDTFEESKGVHNQGKGTVITYTTENGFELKGDINHLFMVVKNDALIPVRGYNLKPGDIILRRLNLEGGSNTVPTDLAQLLGFMHGDGCMVGKAAEGKARWKIYMRPGELEVYEPIFRKYVPTQYKTRIHYTCKDGTPIYVIEGNASNLGFDTKDVSSDKLRVPQVIMEGNLAIRRAYLHGIFQADGWFSNDLGVTSVSKQYIHDIALLLTSCGIDCTIHVNGYYTRNKNGNHKSSYYVLVSKAYQEKFCTEIGFDTKNHEVTEVGNRTKAYLINSIECMNLFREEYAKRDYCGDLDCFYRYPSIVISDNKIRKINQKIWKKLSKDSVLRLVASGNYVSDVIAQVVKSDATEDMYDVVETESNLCVYGDFLTHNCSEGTVAGPFREKDFELIKKDLDETKRRGASNSIGFYAYNLNYYSKIFELLSYAGQNFSSLSLINMRVDEIANNPDFLTLAKALGQIRNSSAIEGCSERVRNEVLNKNLSKETLLVAVRTVMEQKFIMAKFGMIRTGIETDADWDDFIVTLEDMLKIRSEVGANTAFQFSFTPLVVYDNIPLRYEPRVTAQQSLDDIKNMGSVLDRVHALGDKYNCYIRCKFNG